MTRLVPLGVAGLFGVLFLATGHRLLGGLLVGLPVLLLAGRFTGGEPTGGADLLADIAAVGANEFLAQCRLVAGPVPDPGHPGGMPIALWQPPARYGRRVLVLECFNGTRDPRTGLYERLAKGVSARHRDPLSAAAASYGVDVATYARLAVRA